jgi:hypothetical protein
MSDSYERLNEASITTPDNINYVFKYEDVSKIVKFKTSKFTFGDKEGSLVQNFGLGEVGLPLQIIFTGPDHDTISNNFEDSLRVAGSSFLTHPVYGTKNIVIEGYTRVDNVKTAWNQTLFDAIMTETIIPAAPVSTEETRTNIVKASSDFIEASSTVFEPNFENTANKESSKNRILSGINELINIFTPLIEGTKSISDAYNEAASFIIANIDDLLNDPAILAGAVQSLIRIPSRALSNVNDRVTAFLNAAQSFQVVVEGFLADKFNQRLEIQLFSSSLLTSGAEAALFANNDFITKKETIETAVKILDNYFILQQYLDTEEQNSIVDNMNIRYVVDPIIADGIKNITSLTAGQLVQLSFSLKQERVIFLQNEETLIPLVHKLYGGKIDDNLDDNIEISKIDFFIQTNNLEPGEIVIMDAGREIKYYV